MFNVRNQKNCSNEQIKEVRGAFIKEGTVYIETQEKVKMTSNLFNLFCSTSGTLYIYFHIF